MRFLLIVSLLFSQGIAVPEGKPTRSLFPVPHWSCPKGYFPVMRDSPEFVECQRYSVHHPPMKKFNAETQELIYWRFSETIPKNGILRINWPSSFVGIPGCDITGDEKHYISFLGDPKKESLALKGKPGTVLTFTCNAILNR